MTTKKDDPKPTEADVVNKPEEEKNVDRDGGERQPSDQSSTK